MTFNLFIRKTLILLILTFRNPKMRKQGQLGATCGDQLSEKHTNNAGNFEKVYSRIILEIITYRTLEHFKNKVQVPSRFKKKDFI